MAVVLRCDLVGLINDAEGDEDLTGQVIKAGGER